MPGSWLLICATVVALLVAAPLVSVALNVVGAGTGATWSHLASTVLGEYVLTTIRLCVGVGVGVVAVGVGAAWLVTRYEFALRRLFEWALVLPLAMPAYVAAYTTPTCCKSSPTKPKKVRACSVSSPCIR